MVEAVHKPFLPRARRANVAAMPLPPGLHYATALRLDLARLMREATLPAYGRRAGGLVEISDDRNHLRFQKPDYRGGLSYLGAQPQPIIVHLHALRANAGKLPRTEFVLMGYADGWLNVGPTCLSARLVSPMVRAVAAAPT